MSRTKQTLASISSDFDRIALLSGGDGEHNERYHAYLLGHVPARCRRALEIGCGTGGFSRLLARRAERVLAVDLSPQMIRAARERSPSHPNIDYVTADAMGYQLPAGEFDCIATLTTLHHLPAEPALRKIRDALKTGGTFVCLDLYQRSRLSDLLFDVVASPASLLLRFVKTGRPRPPRELRDAYAEHGRTDTYLTLPQVEQTFAEIMPGALLRRHLFWRYSVVWKKGLGDEA